MALFQHPPICAKITEDKVRSEGYKDMSAYWTSTKPTTTNSNTVRNGTVTTTENISYVDGYRVTPFKDVPNEEWANARIAEHQKLDGNYETTTTTTTNTYENGKLATSILRATNPILGSSADAVKGTRTIPGVGLVNPDGAILVDGNGKVLGAPSSNADLAALKAAYSTPIPTPTPTQIQTLIQTQILIQEE